MKKITINNLSFYYESKDTMVFDSLSLEFSSEKIYALVGSNGVGKTTLLNILSGIYQPTGGTIEYDGTLYTEKVTKEKVAFIPYKTKLYPYLDVFDHIKLIAELWGIKTDYLEYKRKVLEYCNRLNLDYYNKRVESYSTGMEYKLYISLMLARDVSLVLLDEPFTMLDKKSRYLAMDLIKEKKIITIFSSHQKDIVEYLSNDIINLDKLKGVNLKNYEKN